MIDHVSLGVRDLHASVRFYQAVLATIGMVKLVVHETTVGFGKQYPELWLNHRPEMAKEAPGSGTHVCLRTRTPEQVQAFHQTALDHDGEDDGPPGPRPEYSVRYYAAFVRDLDGHRLEVVTFLPEK